MCVDAVEGSDRLTGEMSLFLFDPLSVYASQKRSERSEAHLVRVKLTGWKGPSREHHYHNLNVITFWQLCLPKKSRPLRSVIVPMSISFEYQTNIDIWDLRSQEWRWNDSVSKLMRYFNEKEKKNKRKLKHVINLYISSYLKYVQRWWWKLN